MNAHERLLDLMRHEAVHVRCEGCRHWRPIVSEGSENRCTSSFSPYHQTQTLGSFWCGRGEPVSFRPASAATSAPR
jgi:hypothetical protein